MPFMVAALLVKGGYADQFCNVILGGLKVLSLWIVNVTPLMVSDIDFPSWVAPG
jgi:hypothetical protein